MQNARFLGAALSVTVKPQNSRDSRSLSDTVTPRAPVEPVRASVPTTGLVPEPEDQVAQEARGRDGHGQEEARLRDGEAEGEFGQRRRRRVQQAAGPQLRRRENHETVEEAQGLQRGPAQPLQQQLGHLVRPWAARARARTHAWTRA